MQQQHLHGWRLGTLACSHAGYVQTFTCSMQQEAKNEISVHMKRDHSLPAFHLSREIDVTMYEIWPHPLAE